MKIGTRVRIVADSPYTSKRGLEGIIIDDGSIISSNPIWKYLVRFDDKWEEIFRTEDLIDLSKLEILGELGD